MPRMSTPSARAATLMSKKTGWKKDIFRLEFEIFFSSFSRRRFVSSAGHRPDRVDNLIKLFN